MSSYKAFLMGGVALGLFSLQAVAVHDGQIFAEQVKARLAQHTAVTDLRNNTRVAEDKAPVNDAAASAAPAAVTAGKTEYYGVGDLFATPPWAQEARVVQTADETGTAAPAAAGEMQPTAGSTETPAAAAPVAAAATAEVVHGTTWYGGDTASSEGQPFSAPATVFEDVKVMEPATEAAPAAAAPEAAPSPAPAAAAEVVHGTTWYPGETSPAEGQPFSAPAAVFITVTDAPAPAPAAAPAAKPAEIVHGSTWYGGETKHAEEQPFSAPAKMMMVDTPAPAVSKVADSCRDQLNAIVQSGRILFANNSFDIRPESYKTLDKLAAAAKSCGGVVIEVGGHTDNTGTIAGNEELSRLRAEAVSKYLAKAGVDATKLKSAGYGQSQPIATNSTTEGRAKNRRIEFLVTGN